MNIQKKFKFLSNEGIILENIKDFNDFYIKKCIFFQSFQNYVDKNNHICFMNEIIDMCEYDCNNFSLDDSEAIDRLGWDKEKAKIKLIYGQNIIFFLGVSSMRLLIYQVMQLKK